MTNDDSSAEETDDPLYADRTQLLQGREVEQGRIPAIRVS